MSERELEPYTDPTDISYMDTSIPSYKVPVQNAVLRLRPTKHDGKDDNGQGHSEQEPASLSTDTFYPLKAVKQFIQHLIEGCHLLTLGYFRQPIRLSYLAYPKDELIPIGFRKDIDIIPAPLHMPPGYKPPTYCEQCGKALSFATAEMRLVRSARRVTIPLDFPPTGFCSGHPVIKE